MPNLDIKLIGLRQIEAYSCNKQLTICSWQIQVVRAEDDNIKYSCHSHPLGKGL